MIVEHHVTIRHEHDDVDNIEVLCAGEWAKFVRERTCEVEYGDDADWHLDCCGWTKANVAYCPWCGAKVVKE